MAPPPDDDLATRRSPDRDDPPRLPPEAARRRDSGAGAGDRPSEPRLSGFRPSLPRPSDADDDGRLSAREQRQIDGAVERVGRGGARGPMAVLALVVAAFLLGLVRPWDLLGGTAGPFRARPSPAGSGSADASGGPGDPGASAVAVGGPASPPADGGPAGPVPTPLAPTCGYPESWRTAAIQEWASSRARVWTAAEAQVAAGPDDPAIVMHVLGSDRVEALGWCAPIAGPERPPRDARGTLFLVPGGDGAAGPAREVAFRRLEPVAADSLGELWVPAEAGASAGSVATWPAGRYVIRLATPDGAYVRYLGLEVGAPPRASPSPSSSAATPGAPSGSPGA